jgi:hypothetical protein
MKALLREPLLHFLVLGAVLFLAYGALSRNAAGSGGEIVVSAAQIENLSTQFERTWQRPPLRNELDGLIESYVREEVLYREGVALGLDRDDPIIRRRVQQKVDFLAENVASQEPTQAQLEEFFATHRDRFLIEPRYSFEQVFVNPEQHGDRAHDAALSLLTKLKRSGAESAAESLGDASLLPRQFDDAREADVIRTFGEAFTRELAGVAPGTWLGPIASPYGLHLVRLTAKSEAREPKLDDVRDVVTREWLREQQERANEAFYATLRKRYRIVIEQPTQVTANEAAKPVGAE